MSEMLSQDEIDALLNGGVLPDSGKPKLSEEELALASEISDVGMKVLADSLLPKLNRNVVIKVKSVDVADSQKCSEILTENLFGISVELYGTLVGNKLILYKKNDTLAVNDLFIGGDGKSFANNESELAGTSIMFEQLKEILPDSVSALAQLIKSDITVKGIDEFQFGEQNSLLNDYISSKELVLVTYSFEIAGIINSEIYELVPVNMIKKTANLLISEMSKEEQAPVEVKKAPKEPKPAVESKKQPVVIQSVKFPSFDESDDMPIREENVDFIMDVNLQITVELGRCKKSIKEILELNIGSVVELDNLAEDYVSVMVNGKLIARGEVVVVDENFGIRIMELYTNSNKNIIS